MRNIKVKEYPPYRVSDDPRLSEGYDAYLKQVRPERALKQLFPQARSF